MRCMPASQELINAKLQALCRAAAQTAKASHKTGVGAEDEDAVGKQCMASRGEDAANENTTQVSEVSSEVAKHESNIFLTLHLVFCPIQSSSCF